MQLILRVDKYTATFLEIYFQEFSSSQELAFCNDIYIEVYYVIFATKYPKVRTHYMDIRYI